MTAPEMSRGEVACLCGVAAIIAVVALCALLSACSLQPSGYEVYQPPPLPAPVEPSEPPPAGQDANGFDLTPFTAPGMTEAQVREALSDWGPPDEGEEQDPETLNYYLRWTLGRVVRYVVFDRESGLSIGTVTRPLRNDGG